MGGGGNFVSALLRPGMNEWSYSVLDMDAITFAFSTFDGVFAIHSIYCITVDEVVMSQ